MCLYNYNNKFQTNTILNNDEYELLSKIYQCIESNDNETVKLLTEQLISTQSLKESVDSLQNTISSLK
ncbi:hypothetical protein [Romboutsia sp.]|uniref:hypothetical protein n=1 Tax=Romboutsia sp. TaxID=1965302 RepID=UPI002C3FE802|nr:hypothetical protein [Romboutsia sp.]HSQ87497.1 hypothetical protein [Romboutsia sp.]